MRTLGGLAVIAILLMAPARAADYELLHASAEVRIGEQTVLGQQSPDSFEEYDLRGAWDTPWLHRFEVGPAIGLRLLGSLGLFRGPDRTAAVASAIPLLTLASAGGRWSVDAGIGLALLSHHRYAQQDFGGPLQYALSAGLHAPLYRRLGLTYRFMHYSDAGAYGPHTVGADLHMAGLTLRF